MSISFRKAFFERKRQQQVESLWLMVEWNHCKNKTDAYSLISAADLLGKFQPNELHTGKTISVTQDGKVCKGSIVIVSADKGFIEAEIEHLHKLAMEIDLSKSTENDNNLNDKGSETESEAFQASDSDWNPNVSDCGSEEEGSINNKPLKRKRESMPNNKLPLKKLKGKLSEPNNKKIMSPSIGPYTSISSRINNDTSKPDNSDFTLVIDSVIESPPERYSDKFDKIINESKQRLSKGFKDVNTLVVEKGKTPPMTFDQQTQTSAVSYDEKIFRMLLDNQRLLRTEMMALFGVIYDMKSQMDSMQKTMNVVQTVNDSYMEIMARRKYTNEIANEAANAAEYNFNDTVPNENEIVLRESNVSYNTLETAVNLRTPNFDTSPPEFTKLPNCSNYLKTPTGPPMNIDNEMIGLGSGKTLIPQHIYNQIKWNSYSSATRKLLMAVFPRRTLATHSLSGKSSPAFTNRPAKMKLDAKKIADIIITVTGMCNVQENLVRNIITTKCSDENKMYKIRMMRMKTKNALNDSEMNQENEKPNNSNLKNQSS